MIYFFIIFVFVSLDIVTGLFYSFKNGKFRSNKMKQGLFSKAAELFAFWIIYFIQWTLPKIGIWVSFDLIPFFVAYIVIMEIGSIFENLGKVNPELGAILSKIFDELKKEEENNGN